MKRHYNPFGQFAAEYDAWFESENGRIIFAQEAACLQGVMGSANGRWLEVGVGTGRFALALGVREGVDPSASMLALAARRGIQVIEAVGECLPYPEHSFDGILMTTTLCFLGDAEKTLRECRRVLKDTGRLVVGVIPADSPWGRLYARRAGEGHPMYSEATFRSCDEVLLLAAHAGFDLQQGMSCLLAPPDSVQMVAETHEGIVRDAGFVAMAFGKNCHREVAPFERG